MNRLLLVLLSLLLIGLCITPALAAEQTVTVTVPASVAEKIAAPVADPPTTTAVEPTGLRDRLSWRERRRLGITVPKMLQARRNAIQDGRITPDMPTSLQALIVAEDLRDQMQSQGVFDGDFNWEEFFTQLIAFLEKLFELLAPFFLATGAVVVSWGQRFRRVVDWLRPFFVPRA